MNPFWLNKLEGNFTHPSHSVSIPWIDCYLVVCCLGDSQNVILASVAKPSSA
jgi:hypothetical protein